MTKPEAGLPKPETEEGLIEDGWSKLDGSGGEFVSEHTTVDPSLLNRLAALDDKKKLAASAKGIKAPERRDRTINLDISDLLAMEVGEGQDKTEEVDASDVEEVLGALAGASAAALKPAPEAEVKPEAEVEPEVEPEAEVKPSPQQDSGSLRSMAGPRAGDSSAQISDVSSPEQPSVELDNAVAEDVAPEFFSEKTQIFIPVMDDEPTRAKIKVIQGGGQQKEYLLARDRVTIGRGTNNDILVPDIAISRQHFEITRQEDGSFRAADLNSGNGTKLNGKRMLDSDLFGGDRIEIGNTILEFLITGPGASRSPGERRVNLHPSEASKASPNRRTGGNPAVQQPSAAAVPNYAGGAGYNATMTHFQLQQAAPVQTNRTGMVLTAAVGLFSLLFLLLAVVIGAKVYLDFQSTKVAQVNNKPASSYFFEGVEHVKTRDWDKAEEKFTIAIDLAREEREFQIRKDAELQLERVRTEKVNEKSFNRGRSLFEKGDYPEAVAKLGSVKPGSVYDDEAKELLLKAKDKYAGELVEQAQTHYAAKQYDEADKKIVIALRTRPGFPAAVALRRKIDSLPDEAYVRPRRATAKDTVRPVKRAETKQPGAAVAAKTPKTPKTSAEDRKGKKSGGKEVANFVPGLVLYRQKQYQKAIDFFKNIAEASDDDVTRNHGTKLAKNVASFVNSYQTGNGAYASSNWFAAAKQLETAYRLDKSISGTGVHGPELREKLAESNFQLAKASFDGNNFQRAGIHVKKVLSYKPNHPGNGQLLSRLESKAKEMYFNANAKRTADPTQAGRIAKAIVDMLPARSETHKKAKKLLSELKTSGR